MVVSEVYSLSVVTALVSPVTAVFPVTALSQVFPVTTVFGSSDRNVFSVSIVNNGSVFSDNIVFISVFPVTAVFQCFW